MTGFRPYFYVPADQAEALPASSHVFLETGTSYRSIRGESLRRLYTQNPGDVREEREQFRHYEADIPFATRFMIDTGLTGGVSAPSTDVDYKELAPADVDAPARSCIIDIECEDERGFPDPQRDAIIAITAFDSFPSDYTTFLLVGGGTPATIAEKAGCRRSCKRLLPEREAYDLHVRRTRPRCSRLLPGTSPNATRTSSPGGTLSSSICRTSARGWSVSASSPHNSPASPGMTERNALRGRALFDLLTAYKKMHLSQKESYRLDAVALEEVGEQKVRYTGTISDLWKTQPELLVEYNFKDVELCVKINKKDNIIEFYREIARYVGCPLDKTLNSSSVVDVFVLRKAFGKYVLPSKGFVNTEEFEGATVFEPSKGVRENVVVLDLKSLYPMAMMTINASMETKDPQWRTQGTKRDPVQKAAGRADADDHIGTPEGAG